MMPCIVVDGARRAAVWSTTQRGTSGRIIQLNFFSRLGAKELPDQDSAGVPGRGGLPDGQADWAAATK